MKNMLELKFVKKKKESDDDNAWIVSRKRRRSLWERVIFAVVFLIVGYFLWLSYSEIGHIRRIMLRQQLFGIRNAVMMYSVMRGELPQSLAVLTRTEAKDKGDVPFNLLGGVRLNEKGEVIDPFGYPYSYDNTSGKVHSKAACCQSW